MTTDAKHVEQYANIQKINDDRGSSTLHSAAILTFRLNRRQHINNSAPRTSDQQSRTPPK